MDAALAGCVVVSTRPQAQAGGLRAALVACGAEVIDFPVIGIEAADPAPLAGIDLARFALAFFVSANAVEQALQIRPRADWPAGLRVATVGPASARALSAAGFAEVIAPRDGFDTEAVLAQPEFHAGAVAGREVLILRGDGGRELLADTLRARGAQVSTLSCYRRVAAPLDPAPLFAALAGRPAALVFTASEGLSFFLEITGARGHALLRECCVVAPHARILAALQEAGAAHAYLVAAGDEGIAAGLADLARQGLLHIVAGRKPGLIG